ncbi:MAG TPA: hypothetical protein DHS57_02275 [Erysipelotrichaceae bacterium]|nr:hypothetical protein [Erysipelotrichaceae bacterium]
MERNIRGIISILILIFSFLIFNYPLFSLHGMKQFPLMIFILAFSISLVSIFFKNDIVPVFASSGYVVGFEIALFLQSENFDPGGGKTSNFWIIWGSITVIFIIVGIIVSKIKKRI